MNLDIDTFSSKIPDASNELSFMHGAHFTEYGIQFSLWAPDASSVSVKFIDQSLHLMDAKNDGWFTTSIPLHTQIKYKFVIDNGLEVPDPASRSQIDDVDGWSCVINHSSYAWKSSNWRGRPWHETIFYELHIGTLGGFSKVEALLPQLAELGITAVELMPLNEFPGSRNWGYDCALPFAPESSYGTPDELKSLIDTAHSLGLMIFIDVVYNHFGPVGNYLNSYAKGFFRDDINTPWGAAIDFRRVQVRNFFIENAIMWLRDYRVDGLRLDAVHAISEKDFLVDLATRVRNTIIDRDVHLVIENEENNATLLEQGFNAQWNDDAHNILHTILTNEHDSYYSNYQDSKTEKLARYLAEGFVYQGEKGRHGKARGEPSSHLPPTSFVVFLQNHDQIGNRAFGERLIELVDQDNLKNATALILLSPAIPLLFMGEENGSRNPFLYFTDHPPELAETVRHGRREEFSDFSAFKDENSRENIPDPNALETFTKSIISYTSEDTEWRTFYKTLISIRHTEIIPRLVNVRCEGVKVIDEFAVSVVWRMDDGSRLRITLNFSTKKVLSNENIAAGKSIFSRGYESNVEQAAIPPNSIKVSIL